MTGIYQPSAARAAAGAPVYSEDVVAAGVRDARRLTPFERRALAEAGAEVYADCLVPAVVAAAFHGLKVAACIVTQAVHERE
jgi:purine nucleoside phosphorylase